MARKKVCIVGAGPSGLVAAKTLLYYNGPGSSDICFSVTIFDPQPRIGGLWPLSKRDGDGLLHPLMVANQSKHTMHFGDFAWDERDPQLPRAWQVGQYLDRYMERYLAPRKDEFSLRLGERVENTEIAYGDGQHSWKITAKSSDGRTSIETFDYVLIASGYFGQPAMPDVDMSNVKVPVVHSSKYRSLESLLADTNGHGRKVLVVGGQMSGVEVAGTIATHISSAVNAPGRSSVAGYDQLSVHHVIQRPPWTFPMFTSPAAASLAAPFVPLDLPSYNLANRPLPLSNTQGSIAEETAQMTHGIYGGVLGTDQSEFSPLLSINDDDLSEPPYLAMSDTYADHVRSGMITLSRGKLSSVSGSTAHISPNQEEIVDVAAIVLATGFEAAPSLSFLPEDLRKTLNVDSKSLPNALALALHGTHHPEVPGVGFVGFYRSPYWGVMEMQARFLAEYWSNANHLTPAMTQALREDTSIERSLGLRNDPRIAQFPMGDYAWLMQEFAAALEDGKMRILPPLNSNLPPLPHNNLPLDFLSPSRYTSKPQTPDQASETQKAQQQTHDTALAGLTTPRFVARGVFRSLLGEWSLERDLVSVLPSHPSGHFSGTAKFLIREGTRDGRETAVKDLDDDELGMEYLYIEDGDFKAADENGMTFRATRRYIWRYDEIRDVLSVWFVKTDDNKRADYLFHELKFEMPNPEDGPFGEKSSGWKAKSDHLCVDDFYDVAYLFAFKAVNLKEWKIGYEVKGPKKDYSINGVYRRILRT